MSDFSIEGLQHFITLLPIAFVCPSPLPFFLSNTFIDTALCECMIITPARCLVIRLNSIRCHLSSVLLNEALTVLTVEEAELFSNILLAFLFSGFFFLDLPSWVCVYLLYPATLADYTSGFRHRLWLLMSPELNLLFLVFLCMIWDCVH